MLRNFSSSSNLDLLRILLHLYVYVLTPRHSSTKIGPSSQQPTFMGIRRQCGDYMLRRSSEARHLLFENGKDVAQSHSHF